MKGIDIYKSLGHISDEMVQEAEQTTGKLSSKKWNWKNCTAMASSIALIFGFSMLFLQNGGSDAGLSTESGGNLGHADIFTESTEAEEASDSFSQIFTAEKLEKLEVQLTSLENGRLYCIVKETSNQENFPINSKLTVVLEENTTVFKHNGEEFLYNAEQHNALEFVLEIYAVIEVDYLRYEEYQEDKGFYNKVYAENIEIS